MAETPESKVKKLVKLKLELAGAYWAMPIGTGYGDAGVPDFLVCHKGRFIGIECKAGTGKLTALQKRNMEMIEEAGGRAWVINEHNVHELPQLLDMK